MAEVVFGDPLGGPYRPVTCDEITQLLKTKGEGFWNNDEGSGFADLYYSFEDNARTLNTNIALVLTVKDGVGVHIGHKRKHGNGRTDWHFAFMGDWDFSKTIQINYSGSTRILPTNLFIPLSGAIEVVSYFFVDGDRTPKVQWLESSKIPWSDFEK